MEQKKYELVCAECVKGRPVLSSTVVPMSERSGGSFAPTSQGGKMQGDCRHFAFTLYTVRLTT